MSRITSPTLVSSRLTSPSGSRSSSSNSNSKSNSSPIPNSIHGYPPSLFLPSPSPSSLHCYLCGCVYRDPVSSSIPGSCHHTYCMKCLDFWLSKDVDNPTCPVCVAANQVKLLNPKDLQADQKAKQSVSELRVKCSECGWIGQFGLEGENFNQHQQTHPSSSTTSRRTCRYHSIGCVYECDDLNQLNAHYADPATLKAHSKLQDARIAQLEELVRKLKLPRSIVVNGVRYQTAGEESSVNNETEAGGASEYEEGGDEEASSEDEVATTVPVSSSAPSSSSSTNTASSTHKPISSRGGRGGFNQRGGGNRGFVPAARGSSYVRGRSENGVRGGGVVRGNNEYQYRTGTGAYARNTGFSQHASSLLSSHSSDSNPIHPNHPSSSSLPDDNHSQSHSRRNSDTVQGPKYRLVCKYFNQPKGCGHGDSCSYVHSRPINWQTIQNSGDAKAGTVACKHFNPQTQAGCSRGADCTFLHAFA